MRFIKTLKKTPLSIICCLLFVVMISSCVSQNKLNSNFVYFNNGKDTIAIQQKETIIQANDLLHIQVYSKSQNQEQASIFNIPASSTSLLQGYQVNASGSIEMPVIGTIKAAGLNKLQLQTSLEQELSAYVKNPSVIVRFLDFNVNVLGEVRAPGAHRFSTDRVTIIDALSAAGDLTDNARRDNVTIIREENGKRIFYKVDVRNRSLFESNIYILQPNDIVYVGPTKNRLKNLNADLDSQRRVGFYLTITSFLFSIANFIIFATR